jgi:glyoxylase-like metal-dependent hydrolase (beta-lactamase superfamily II)
MEPKVHTIFEPVTGTWQYIVADPSKKEAVIIDSVLDYNKDTGVLSTTSADKLLELVMENDYSVSRILETHAHADHLTASRYLQNMLGQRHHPQHPLVCIGKRISGVQETMGRIYSIPTSEMQDAFDYTFSDDETFRIGDLEAQVVPLPGHTPDHIGYIIGSNIFTGDSIFNPDVGSARCDFPGGSATTLYKSMQKLLSFPGHFRLYTGHDYPPKERCAPGSDKPEPVPYTTVEAQSKGNKHVKSGTQMEDFVKWRTERDSSLSEPKLLRQSMHVNVRGGRLPSGPVEGFKLERVPANVPKAD